MADGSGLLAYAVQCRWVEAATFDCGDMGFQTVRPYLSRFALGFALGLPVAVTFVENVGSLKGVHGISMQVSEHIYQA